MAAPVMRAAADVLDLLSEGVAALALSVGDALDDGLRARPAPRPALRLVITSRPRGARSEPIHD